MDFWTFSFLIFLCFSFALSSFQNDVLLFQNLILPRVTENRENLTLRVTALCPDSWGYSNLYLSGTWNAPMLYVGEDTWQFDFSYSSYLDGYKCNNCDNVTGSIDFGDHLKIKILAIGGHGLRLKFIVIKNSKNKVSWIDGTLRRFFGPESKTL